MLLLLLSSFFINVFDAGAQFFYDENCRYATGLFQYSGHAIGYTAGQNIDNPGDGWLRLTNTGGFQLGYVKLDKTFPSTMGVVVEFDFKTWANTSSLADGFSVFLFDGDPDKTFQIGDAGGYLGYLNMKPAYLGVGIDEYGNFSNDPIWGGNSSGMVTHAIAVRKADYRYVAGTATQLGNNILLAHNSVTRPDDNTFYRRVRIEMEPLTGSIEGMSVTVLLKTAVSGAYQTVLGPVNVEQPTPARLGLGFAGATGSFVANHEVRDVIIRTPGDLYVTKSSECTNTKDRVVFHTVVGNNSNVTVDDIVVNDTLPAGFTLTEGPTITSGSGSLTGFATGVPPGDGRTPCSYKVSVNAQTPLFVTFSGHFDVMPTEGQDVSSVEIEPPTSVEDANTDDNRATLTGMIATLSANRTDFVLTGAPVTLNVTARNSAGVASYTWTQSDDNGATWSSPLPTTTASHIHSGTTYALVRCIAQWNTGCRDTVIFRLYEAPDNISDED
jgi:uncharacterized repeat protein (TIGR01451 family)